MVLICTIMKKFAEKLFIMMVLTFFSAFNAVNWFIINGLVQGCSKITKTEMQKYKNICFRGGGDRL